MAKRPPEPTEVARQLHLRVMQLESLLRVNQLVTTPYSNSPFAMLTREHQQFTQANLLAFILSMLFSVFDPRGVHLGKLKTEDDFLAKQLGALLKKWKPIERPVQIVRNCFGFHGAPTLEGTEEAFKAIKDALGEPGLKTAFELIGDVIKIAPELKAEAGLTFRVPSSVRSQFEQLESTYQKANAAMSAEPRDIAAFRQASADLRPMYEELRVKLDGAVAPEERQHLPHFSAEWEAKLQVLSGFGQLHELSERVARLGKGA